MLLLKRSSTLGHTRGLVCRVFHLRTSTVFFFSSPCFGEERHVMRGIEPLKWGEDPKKKLKGYLTPTVRARGCDCLAQ